jgi:hypothetical protein
MFLLHVGIVFGIHSQDPCYLRAYTIVIGTDRSHGFLSHELPFGTIKMSVCSPPHLSVCSDHYRN